MNCLEMHRAKQRSRRPLSALLGGLLLLLAGLAACGPSAADLAAVDYAPLAGDDWPVSTPEEQELDPALVAELHYNAAEVETIKSLLVVENGHLVAEHYFNGGSLDEKTLIQSASKSYISALVGIAIEEGCLSSVDQKMIEFFPEVEDELTDPRKREISIRQMLQMRSGYPDEETDAAYLEALYWGVYPPLIEGFPLVSDPGTAFHYSNLTYSWLAIILERAWGPGLGDFARQHLFEPTGTEVEDWLKDREGNYIGSGGIHASLQTYSEGARDHGWGFASKDLGYGYGWWTASAGNHGFSFAWGHAVN